MSLDLLQYTDPLMTFAVPTAILLFGGVALPGGAVSIMVGYQAFLPPLNLPSVLVSCWETYLFGRRSLGSDSIVLPSDIKSSRQEMDDIHISRWPVVKFPFRRRSFRHLAFIFRSSPE